MPLVGERRGVTDKLQSQFSTTDFTRMGIYWSCFLRTSANGAETSDVDIPLSESVSCSCFWLSTPHPFLSAPGLPRTLTPQTESLELYTSPHHQTGSQKERAGEGAT